MRCLGGRDRIMIEILACVSAEWLARALFPRHLEGEVLGQLDYESQMVVV